MPPRHEIVFPVRYVYANDKYKLLDFDNRKVDLLDIYLYFNLSIKDIREILNKYKIEHIDNNNFAGDRKCFEKFVNSINIKFLFCKF